MNPIIDRIGLFAALLMFKRRGYTFGGAVQALAIHDVCQFNVAHDLWRKF